MSLKPTVYFLAEIRGETVTELCGSNNMGELYAARDELLAKSIEAGVRLSALRFAVRAR